METKINIAEILENKSQGTKLYSLTYGDCFYQEYTGDFGIECQSQNGVQFNLDEYGKYCIDGECIIFPSKDMREWSKFAWKRGDVLLNSSGFKLFFDRWANDDYTRFFGKVNLLEDSFSYETEKYTLASKEENLDTLEIEKSEFKDGDILIYKSEKFTYFSSIFILNTNRNEISSYVRFSIGKGSIDYDVPVYNLGTDRFRHATEEEKEQLFSALEKKRKAWDAEKKAIVDLKLKIELKPFDKVLVRDSESDKWRANLFGYIDKDEYYHCVYANWAYCIPYIGNESLLGTTKDVED
jgi:hypothetical protein